MMKKKTTGRAASASVDSGASLMKGGSWAGQRLLSGLNTTGEVSSAMLRDLDTLRKNEWENYDQALVEAGVIRLRGVQDLIGAGLTIPVANGLGKTIHQYEKVTDMNEAEISLDGMSQTEDDRQTFSLASLPLPITHKGFSLNLRTLRASRERGETLDTTQVRTAGRLIGERVEKMLFQGYAANFLGFPIYGYTTHTDRNTGGFITNGNWAQSAKVGADVLADVLKMIGALEADRFFGPYWVYVDSLASTKLDEDFKANSDLTIRQRLLQIDRIQKVQVADQMPANTVVMVQPTRDVAAMVMAEPLQTVQWDVEGGFKIIFKGFTIMVPLVRSDSEGRCGVYHMS